MATTHSSRENGTDATEELLPTYRDLGIDAEGYHHAQDRRRDVIHRIDPATGERERVSELRTDAFGARGNALEAYVHEFVGGEVGWLDRTLTCRDLFGEA